MTDSKTLSVYIEYADGNGGHRGENYSDLCGIKIILGDHTMKMYSGQRGAITETEISLVDAELIDITE